MRSLPHLQPPTSGPENIRDAELIVISLFRVKESRNTLLIFEDKVEGEVEVEMETDLAQQFVGCLPSVLLDPIE